MFVNTVTLLIIIHSLATGPQSSSLADGDIIKTAMDSATRAISSSLKTVNKGRHDFMEPNFFRLSEFLFTLQSKIFLMYADDVDVLYKQQNLLYIA